MHRNCLRGEKSYATAVAASYTPSNSPTNTSRNKNSTMTNGNVTPFPPSCKLPSSTRYSPPHASSMPSPPASSPTPHSSPPHPPTCLACVHLILHLLNPPYAPRVGLKNRFDHVQVRPCPVLSPTTDPPLLPLPPPLIPPHHTLYPIGPIE